MMCLGGGEDYDDNKNHDTDLEVRDYFAGKVLQGLLSANPSHNYDDKKALKLIIKASYMMADMMMKERDK